MCMGVLQTWYPRMAEESIGSHGTGITVVSPMWVLGIEAPTELSLQSPSSKMLKGIHTVAQSDLDVFRSGEGEERLREGDTE